MYAYYKSAFYKKYKTTSLPRKYLMSYKHKGKEKWDVFVLILALQNSIAIPIDLTFQPEFMGTTVFQVFDNIIDAFFLMDMILMFFTSYLDKTGNEVFQALMIARKYVRTFRFLADFLAILGTGVVTSLFPTFKIFGIFKVVRILRLGAMITAMNVPEDVKALLNLIKLIFYLCLFLHVLGCVWFYVCRLSFNQVDDLGLLLTWYPPTDWLWYEDSILFTDEYGILEKYLISVYHGVLVLGSNEMGPTSAE